MISHPVVDLVGAGIYTHSMRRRAVQLGSQFFSLLVMITMVPLLYVGAVFMGYAPNILPFELAEVGQKVSQVVDSGRLTNEVRSPNVAEGKVATRVHTYDTVYEYVEALPADELAGATYDSEMGATGIALYGTLQSLDVAKGEGVLSVSVPGYLQERAVAKLGTAPTGTKGQVPFAFDDTLVVRDPFSGDEIGVDSSEFTDATRQSLLQSFVLIRGMVEEGTLVGRSIAIAVL